MIYQYYDPHPNICRMKQYECCSNYHSTCPLYHICKDMKGYVEASKICKRDCATCDYAGCTMSMEKRNREPLYVNGITTVEPLYFPVDQEREKEKALHKSNHRKLRHLYNMLWSEDYQQKNIERCKKYRAENREKLIAYFKKRYKTNFAVPPEEDKRKKRKNPLFFPPCGYDCFNCTKPDCDISYDYYEQQYRKHYLDTHKEETQAQQKAYRKQNKEKCAQRTKAWKEKNKEHCRQYMKEYRQKNKERLSAYDKQYREAHREHYLQYMKDYHKNTGK